MAYNNMFPAGYQPMGYMPQMAPVNQPQQQNNGIIWIAGEAAAKAYMMAPNTTLPLWDSERQSIYLKSTDASGMPSIKILDYTIRDNPQQAGPVQTSPDYVTHDELRALEEKITNAIEEVKHESNTTNANGRRTKKQSDGGIE